MVSWVDSSTNTSVCCLLSVRQLYVCFCKIFPLWLPSPSHLLCLLPLSMRSFFSICLLLCSSFPPSPQRCFFFFQCFAGFSPCTTAVVCLGAVHVWTAAASRLRTVPAVSVNAALFSNSCIIRLLSSMQRLHTFVSTISLFHITPINRGIHKSNLGKPTWNWDGLFFQSHKENSRFIF